MNPGHAASNRQRLHDKYYLSRFIEKLLPGKEGQLIEDTSPEFWWIEANQRTGIEVSSLDILNVNRHRTGLIDKVLQVVENHCREELALPLHVNIFLDLPYRAAVDPEKIGSDINAWIVDVVGMYKDRESFSCNSATDRPNPKYPVLPKYVKSIALICDPRIEDQHVSNMGAFWSGHLKPEYLDEIIQAASQKAKTYRENNAATPLWLVIYTEAEPYDDSDIDLLAKLEVTSPFDRIFFFIHLPQMPYCEIQTRKP
ncbi:MAG: hypothetical protein JNL57_02400 [Bacteroidetes bacterium]|nr:hypothetical protein [Bacteroidota bacterium]